MSIAKKALLNICNTVLLWPPAFSTARDKLHCLKQPRVFVTRFFSYFSTLKMRYLLRYMSTYPLGTAIDLFNMTSLTC